MITITNVGPFNDPDPSGVRNYELRINNDLITTFKHKRSDGLAWCLAAAADAVTKHESEKLDTTIRSLNEYLKTWNLQHKSQDSKS